MLVLFIQKTTCVSGEIGDIPKENEDTADSNETFRVVSQSISALGYKQDDSPVGNLISNISSRAFLVRMLISKSVARMPSSIFSHIERI